MNHWPLPDCDVTPHHPQVLSSGRNGRAILLELPAGEALQEHQVHETSWLVVISGEAELDTGGSTFTARAGALIEFEPAERRTVTAQSDVRLLMILTPWPGDGHPSA